MDVLQNVLVLFGLMAVGVVCFKTKLVGDEGIQSMSKLLINASMPAMILVSLQKPFSWELLGMSGLIVGSQFALYAGTIPLVLGLILLVRTPKADRGILEYGSIFGNVAFMGFPVIDAIYGKEGLFHASLCIVPFSFLAFSLGAWLIARGSHAPLKLSPRLFINPNSVATVAGFLFFAFSVEFPAPLYRGLSLLGGLTTPLSMIITGCILAGADLKKAFSSFGIYAAMVLRLAVLPAIFFGVLWLAGFRGLMLAVPVILAGMPAASNTPIMARLYGGNAEIGSAFVAVSTLFSAVTIPVLAALLSQVPA